MIVVFQHCYKNISKLIIEFTIIKKEGAAVEGPPAMGSSLQLSKCVLLYVLAVLGLSRLSDGGNGRCHGNEVIRGKAARGPYDTC